MIDRLDMQRIWLASAADCEDINNGFYSWHVNFITINRHKTIVCMNNLTRYIIVLYRPKAKDIAHLGDLVKEGIYAAFIEEGVPKSIIDEYLRRCGDVIFSKTAGKRIVANLNEACKIVSFFAGQLDEESILQQRLSLVIGRRIVKFNGVYDYPSEHLFKELCKMKGIPEDNWEQMLQIENYQLKIKLLLNGHDIWRRIMIPSRSTFAQLHEVIQVSFGWFDYHLHEFAVPDRLHESKRNTPSYAGPIKIRIIDGEDMEAGEFLDTEEYEIRYDNRTSLSDVFENADRCSYTYDFGDGWEHEILLEKVIKGSSNRFPVLLEMKGERPPEDVGGPAGFEEFLNIISDPKSPEY